MTDGGLKAMAAAMHEAKLEAHWLFTDTAVTKELKALRAQDNAETIDMSATTTEIAGELGKTAFKDKVAESKSEM